MTARRLFRMVIPRFPLFNIYTRVARKMTALGPLVVATAVSRLPGWDVEVIDENNYRDPGPRDTAGLTDHAALQALHPADAVGFYGGLSSTIPRLLAVAHFYQDAGVLTLGGGQHLDALPADALAGGLDVVIHGEGEQTVVDVLAAWEGGQPFAAVPGVSFLREGQVTTTSVRPVREDFEDLPLPDYGLLRYAHLGIFPVSRIRGCGMACEFCTVRGRPRCASPESLLRQVAHLVESAGAREFFVVDDHFAQDRDETLRFCRLLADYQQRLGIRLLLTVQIRLDCGDDAELLAAMYAASIRVLAIGLESPIDEELKAMNKRLCAADMVALVHRFRDAGFMVHGMFIFGYPQRAGSGFSLTCRQRVAAYRRFIKVARLDTIQILLPVPLPGTPFRERMAAAGRLVVGDGIGWEHYDGTFPLVVPDAPMTAADLHRAQGEIMGGFYRFGSILGVALHTVTFPFPFLMLPLIGLHGRWHRWHRRWRNLVIACAGSLVLSRWRRSYRASAFPAHLLRLEGPVTP